MRKGSWSVVSTIRAPQHQVDTFIRHYINLGADKIYVFFDDPVFSSYDEQAFGHKVHATVCDDSYWFNSISLPPYKNIKDRPDTIEIRQHINMLGARERMDSDWLLHVDVDELVYARKKVSRVLSEFPENVFSVVLRTLEASYDRVVGQGEDFSTNYFRSFTRNESVLSKFIDADVKSVSWGGYWGVTIGKTFVRKHPEIKRMSVHRPVPLDANLYENVETDYLDMLHFEGQSFPAFKEKSLLRLQKDVAKLMNSRFKKRLELIKGYFEASGEQGLFEAYRKFYVIEGAKLEEALALGFVVKLDWQNYDCKSDGLDIVSNPAHYRGQKISGWQGDVVKTAHSRYLSMSTDRVVLSEDPAKLTKPDSNTIPVEIVMINGIARLLVRLESGNLYAAVKDDGSITMQSSINASSNFNCVAKDENGFALMFGSKFMTAAKDGSITVSRNSADAWETFRVRHVYPQLSFFA